MNYLKEKKKFKTENPTLSTQELDEKFKIYWENLKNNENNTIENVEISEEEKLKQNGIKFYNEKLKGKTMMDGNTVVEFRNLYEKICKKQCIQFDCPSCVERMVKNFKYSLGL